LSAIIDFGTSGVGDPSCDLAIAWTSRRRQPRSFRERIAVDEATWARGRGWTLWKALITLPDTTPTRPRPQAAPRDRRSAGRSSEVYVMETTQAFTQRSIGDVV